MPRFPSPVKLLRSRQSKRLTPKCLTLPGFISVASLTISAVLAFYAIPSLAGATTYWSPSSSISGTAYNTYYNSPSTVTVSLGNGTPNVWYQVTTSPTAPSLTGSGWTQVKPGSTGTVSNVKTKYRYRTQTSDTITRNNLTSALSAATLQDYKNKGYSVSSSTTKTIWKTASDAFLSYVANPNGAAYVNHWLTDCQNVETFRTYPLKGRTPVYKNIDAHSDTVYNTIYASADDNTRCRFSRSGFFQYSNSGNNNQFTTGIYASENLNPGKPMVAASPATTNSSAYGNGTYQKAGITNPVWNHNNFSRTIYELGIIIGNQGDWSVLLHSNKNSYYNYFTNPSYQMTQLNGYNWNENYLYSPTNGDVWLAGVDFDFSTYNRSTLYHYTFTRTVTSDYKFSNSLPSESNVINRVQTISAFDVKIGENATKDNTYYVYVKQDDGLGTSKVELAGKYNLDAQAPTANNVTSSSSFCTIENNTYYPKANSTFTFALGATDSSWLKNLSLSLVDATNGTRRATASYAWGTGTSVQQTEGTNEMTIAYGSNKEDYKTFEFKLTPKVSGRLYELYYAFTDRHGHETGLIRSSQGIKVLVDWESPTVELTASNSWQNTAVPVKISASDSGGAGIKTVEYRLYDLEAEKYIVNWTTIPNDTTIYVSNPGEIVVQARATDKSCNESSIYKTTVYVDIDAPTLNSVKITNTEYISGNDHWVQAGNKFNIELSAKDDWSQTALTELQLYSGETGSQVIGAHNWTLGDKTQLSISNPIGTISILSGTETLNNYYYRDFNYTINPITDGKTFNVRYRFTDSAGNVRGFTDTLYNIRVDGQDPVCSIQTVSGWVNKDVTASAQCTDYAGSGIAKVYMKAEGANTTNGWVEAQSLSLTNPGITTVYAYAEDNVGNESNDATRQVTIDKENPIISIYASPTDWVNGIVDVTATASDDREVYALEYYMQGATDVPNWTPYTQTLQVSNDGITTVYVRAIDVAGNVSEVKSVTVRIDLYNPTVERFEIIVK